jgi:SAM-dependent methyltransferase
MGDLPGIKALGKLHRRFVHQRRVTVLAELLAKQLSPGCRLLDVGCGDGQLDLLLRSQVEGLHVQGVEVFPRPDCAIECRAFDGSHLPFTDGSFDGCLFVDVLHHTIDPAAILRDACRVSREFILIKDHVAETPLDRWTLGLMDWVGNRPHGVVLPYAYLSSSQWNELERSLGLDPIHVNRRIPLYSAPFSLVFGRNLHMISLLRKEG